MEETKREKVTSTEPQRIDVQSLVKQAVEEYTRAQQAKAEPAYRAELQEERKRREQLERRVNDLIEENKRSRQIADEAERSAAGKVDLAFKAVKDDIARTDEGRLVARTESGEVALKDYLTSFVTSNPEFLPARISGGSGMQATQKSPSGGGSIDLDKIRPGMSPEDLDNARQEIARVAAQYLRGS